MVVLDASHMASIDEETGVSNIEVWQQKKHCAHRKFGVSQNWGGRFAYKVVKCSEIPEWVTTGIYGHKCASDAARSNT